MYLVIPEDCDVLDDTSGHVIEDLERAVVLRDALALDARTAGDAVEYRLFRLVPVAAVVDPSTVPEGDKP